ncbi:protein COFACTOR ASSEMBLY OF COMPLEX C SUBUNIT B CCB2, chloroplastic-like isoform X1 [Papaver somniferum]|uniref:protein COFACTOR ASSEMBLY OF COMPLEX C SUBUNIT B CCB2, chloroplastic-like isoform X1 n=1 Tax=Papaver somniferum TaxID=3469 RepID=UPI000E6F53ED|nr:protein COFACTOR ASSEMBLY OF COMPLEX C SUBUNIT B CCB2, chloroplastic-like isoform X1 [Papaver somniferum]XP_026381687.1 protein COFACTOR ASSEMBLY OF COMPLEX C SUBUNIT B CCB2, chloroplastic-like isoform X1 [Papaver somniferum]
MEKFHFPQGADSAICQMLPEGTHSLLVQPVSGDPNSTANETTKKIVGFILLASCMSYAYNDTDRAWTSAVADKFKAVLSLACLFKSFITPGLLYRGD